MPPTPATVRLPRVEALLGAPIDRALPVAAVERLVDEGVSESDQLEFKVEMYGTSDDDKAELAKDVCALANHGGGLIIVGIAEVKGRASATKPFAASDLDVRHVQSVLVDRTAPFPSFDAFVVGAAPEAYLVIAVAPSPWAPHATLTPGEPQLRFPIRNGSQTRYLREPELADRYRDRSRAVTDQVVRLDRVIAEATTELDRSAPWVYVACVPNLLGHGSVTSSTVREANGWTFGDRRPGLFNRYLTHGINEVGVGRVRSAHRREPGGGISLEHTELHLDGSAFVASQEDHLHPEGHTYQLGIHTMTDLALALTSAVAQHAARVAGAGDGIVEMGVLAPSPLHAMALCGTDFGPFGPITDRRLTAVPASRHTVDLGAAATDATDLLVSARLLATDIVQAFGVAEISHIDADGRLVSRSLPGSLGQAAKAWAARYGAEVV